MIDLHTHSTASDGSCTPERLIEIALAAGLRALALTDHDTLDGISRARARAAGTFLRFIAGVEIEIERPEGEFHLLGIGLDGDVGALLEALSGVQAARRAMGRFRHWAHGLPDDGRRLRRRRTSADRPGRHSPSGERRAC